jgi:hypothetical protein
MWPSLQRLLANRPDILILHQRPEHEKDGPATDDISTALAAQEMPPSLIVFGHCKWPARVTQRGSSTLVSTDHRVILLADPVHWVERM